MADLLNFMLKITPPFVKCNAPGCLIGLIQYSGATVIHQQLISTQYSQVPSFGYMWSPKTRIGGGVLVRLCDLAGETSSARASY